MPRAARVILPGAPHHIVHRGHNRAPVFFQDKDFLYYLNNLEEWKCKLDVRVYSYCLMTNHVHLILEPSEDLSSIGQLMKHLAARQARRVNRLRKRTGALWEGRYKASPIQAECYLLQCLRYVDLNPVKANIVDNPADYRWSSHRVLAGKDSNGWLDEHELYLSLGKSSPSRQRYYEDFVDRQAEKGETELIEQAVSRNQLTGDEGFIRTVERLTGHRIENRGRGRPPRKTDRK